jgi:sulfate permease, SulP family
MSNGEATFAPAIIKSMRAGYDFQHFKADILSGLTVAVVALPLSMAIGIASHLSPGQGLFTAIIGGFIISVLGGSRFQIGGPAGAFIVLVASIVDRFGIDGLMLATLMAGCCMFAMGALGFGKTIKFVPHPVIVGFTAAIAIIIFASQIKDLLGLRLQNIEPNDLAPKLVALWQVLPSANVAAIAVSVLSIAIILAVRRYTSKLPSLLIAVVVSSAVVAAFHLQVTTIATKFGSIPNRLPIPQIPHATLATVYALIPSALSLAVLGSIESLLSAVVADKMSGTKHNSNTELMAQGLANLACALFGSIVATGTIARTATNVRAGAHSPMAGVAHSAFLLLFMLLAAPLAGYIPLSTLAGVLTVVCWNMADKAEFSSVMSSSRSQGAILLTTFLLTIFVSLITGIIAGLVLHVLMRWYFANKDHKIDEPL